MTAPRALLAVICFSLTFLPAHAQDKKEKPALPSGTLAPADWKKFSTAPLAAGELDKLVADEQKKADVKPAPKTSDEQFIRRVYLDITGKLPAPADVKDFLDDKAPDKRAKLIDKLLESDEFCEHWSNYWRDVITSRTTDFRTRLSAGTFKRWMQEQLKENKSWSAITREILTATGGIKTAEPDKNGQAFFLMSRTGADSQTEIASETSRIFLGIQIQCAQCHDHPSDVWKREQFHEFTAYFARLKERPVFEEKKIVGQTIVSLPFGEHKMPSADNPKAGGKTMKPKFLDGRAPDSLVTDIGRRRALADAIVSKDNPWFAAAFVNRIWGSLMGQAFYSPIDDLGPEKEAMMPEVIGRVAGSFKGSDYDIKKLYREILNSETYQRQIRPGESTDDHLLFASAKPNRMQGDQLWNSLVGVLGPIQAGGRGFGAMFGGPFARFGSIEGQFKQEFSFDPSTKAEEIEGSVSQALMLMNNAAINARMKAAGPNVLGRILSTYTADDEALPALYLKTLARRPTERELSRCKQHIREAGSRAEAYEDILWALINSTEFQTRR